MTGLSPSSISLQHTHRSPCLCTSSFLCLKCHFLLYFQVFVVVQLLSHLCLFAAPWTAAYQASLSFTISRSLLKLMAIDSVMRSNPLVLCHSLLLLPSIFLSVRVFSNELALHIWWPKYCLIFKAQRMFPCPRKNQVLLLILLSQFLLHFAWRYS